MRGLGGGAEDPKGGKAFASQMSLSPDRRFAIERVNIVTSEETGEVTDDSPFLRVIERKTRRVVARIPKEGQAPFPLEAKFLWAPDSKRFAWNCRAGGRDERTALFQYDDGKFVELKDAAEEIGRDVVGAEHERQFKALNLPADTYRREIWDSWQATRWKDNATLELTVTSLRTVADPTTNEAKSLEARFRLTLKFDQQGRWRLIKTVKVLEPPIDRENR